MSDHKECGEVSEEFRKQMRRMPVMYPDVCDTCVEERQLLELQFQSPSGKWHMKFEYPLAEIEQAESELKHAKENITLKHRLVRKVTKLYVIE